MVGHGRHTLDQPHVAGVTLEEYVLGQLLAEQESAVRQHLAVCSLCRAQAAEVRALCNHVCAGLNRELKAASPSPRLDFEQVASKWRKPPTRVQLTYRLRALMPSPLFATLLVVFSAALLLLFPSGDTVALRNLELVKDFHGPPMIVAAATEDGLVVVHLAPGRTTVVRRLPWLTYPSNLQLSPDGRWLAVYEDRVLHVIEMRAAGLHLELTVNETADWAWSPDGASLAYTDGGGQLLVFDTESQTSQHLVPRAESAWGGPVWSSSGASIAYSVVVPLPLEGGSRLRQSLWRVDVATGYRVELARNPAPEQTLIVPAVWSADDTLLVAWDLVAGLQGETPTLYRADVTAHRLDPLPIMSSAIGARLAWPVSAQGRTLAVNDGSLVVVSTSDGTLTPVANAAGWPQVAAWAPDADWLATTVKGAAPGRGLQLMAPSEGTLREMTLPEGAVEHSVLWAGPEHLLAIRQRHGAADIELWLVPLSTDHAPQRILAHVRLPDASPYNGWQWQDVLAAQVVPPA